jgi:hypothetical protein
MHSSFKRLFCFFAVPVLSLMIICLPAQAQHRSPGMNADGNLLGGSKAGSYSGGYITSDGWSASVNAGYEAPVGDMKNDYKGGTTFGLTIGKKVNHVTFSGTVDYRQYKPKQPFSELDPTQPGLGTITIGNFTGIGVYVSSTYEFLITPGSCFYIGINGGYIYSSTTVEINTPFGSDSSPSKLRSPYIAPKIGLDFAVTNTINVGVQAKYSLKMTGVYDSPISLPEYTTSFGSMAGNLVVTYNF